MGSYTKVPVDFGRMEFCGTTLIGAFLRIGKTRLTTVVGYGSTEREAFVDLLSKLACEEVK